MNQKIIFASVAMFLVLLGVGYYLFQVSMPQEDSGDDRSAAWNPSGLSPLSENQIACAEDSMHVVVNRYNADYGRDLLVKYKSSPEQVIPCEYAVSPGDFELEKIGGPYFFLGLRNGFLLLDSGTSGPPRGLLIYDLGKRAQVFTDLYNKPFELEDTTFTYWTPVDDEVTKENCPELAEYTETHWGAGIEIKVTLDLTTLTKMELGEQRCSPRE